MATDSTNDIIRVFWDLEDFPVPEGRKISEIIDFFLTRKGTKGEVSITAYGETAEAEAAANLDSGITFVRKRGKYWRLNKIIIDFAFCIVDYPEPFSTPPTLIVVAKDMTRETEFVFILQNVSESKGFNVLLVVPDDVCRTKEVSLPRVNSVWHWTSLLEGGEPIPESELELRGLVEPAPPEWELVEIPLSSLS